MASDARPYMDYLDKEMTIMGILSAFCFGSVALIGKESKLLEAMAQGDALLSNKYFLLVGTALLLMAGALFYLQRSRLAVRYEELAFWATAAEGSQSAEDVVLGSDTWSFWTPYQSGLCLVIAGFLSYAGALMGFSAVGASIYLSVVVIIAMAVVVRIGWVRRVRDQDDASSREDGSHTLPDRDEESKRRQETLKPLVRSKRRIRPKRGAVPA